MCSRFMHYMRITNHLVTEKYWRTLVVFFGLPYLAEDKENLPLLVGINLAVSDVHIVHILWVLTLSHGGKVWYNRYTRVVPMSTMWK